MIKKYLYLLLALPLVALSFQSCIKDESYGPSGNSSKLSLAQDLQEKYTLNRWDTLKISPNVVQTNEQKKVDYEWEVMVRWYRLMPLLNMFVRTSALSMSIKGEQWR